MPSPSPQITTGHASAETSANALDRLANEFPDAESLGRHKQIRAKLQLETMGLREEIAKLKAELKRDQDPGKMSNIQSEIGQLMLQINVIREKAAEAEAIVKGITSDIQRLDVAKSNLTTTIQTLERWAMLKQAHQQLSQLLPTRRYKEISQALAAVMELLGPLKPLSSIPTVFHLFKAAENDRKTVQEKVAVEMDAFFRQDPNKPVDKRTISEVCLAVDVLGGDFRNHIIERYLQLQLAEYRRIFRATDEAGQLDNVPRRYAWFRRVLKHHDEEDAMLFPDSWQVTRLLVANFSECTRSDLANVLAKQTPAVSVLLDALQGTLDFESGMSRKFGMPFEEVASLSLRGGTSKWVISSIFDKYLSVYVDAQNRAISDMLSAYRGLKSRSSLESAIQEETDAPAPTILPSSTELFYFYGQQLDQCEKYSKGETMKKLAQVFAKWLKIYADDVLLAGLKPVRKSLEGRDNLQEVKTACMVLNTAEYCLNTSLQLEERLKDKIDPKFREEISFQDQRESLSSVMSTCITAILRELETACEPAFAAILKTPWMHLENVSGRSAYVVDLVGSIKQVAEAVRGRVESKKYIRNFADKAVGVVITKFTQSVIKSRPLKKIGAEQILLDVQAVKACLLDLPEPHPENSTTIYTKYVTKNTGQLETMLKVILAPDDPPEGFVQNYCLLIGDRSFTNFQKILDLKGTPRTDQQRLLDIFLSVTSTNSELSDTSFLTHIDMDPPASVDISRTVISPVGSSASLFSPTSGVAGLPSLLRSGSTDGTERSETPKAFGEFRRLVNFATRRDNITTIPH
ncbi:vacuolar-sorting protein 53 long isoform [Cryptococcus bacillisporus CA1873]|uniref:Vacuolar-sorting protein 53 long isoform n=1 Tax=Cryptococcus bacillisporus CA1873 TaxID=1296111 RepID=A0ABR5BDY4_CRYGA|nr:vacuolar-sorting protein 53 long isoform [Cryptococcus bacillisporus CA1873]|eukprot:KIR67392.1 vacuolar-sorting protein 53 long isoform [Cryptococcus gattii CA1873]